MPKQRSSKKYHISPDGKARRCTAKKECPVGGQHYDSVQEANEAFYYQTYGLTPSKRRWWNSSFKRQQFFKKTFKGAVITVVGLTLGCTMLTMCHTTIDTDEQPYWKGYEDAVAEQRTNDLSNNVEELTEKAKQKAEEYAKRLTNSSSANSDSSITYDTSGVYFQGQNITPSVEEVSNAQNILNSLVVQEEIDGSGYDRTDSQWSFNNNTVSQVEQRDVTNGSFNFNGRAVGGSSFIDPYTGETVTIETGSSYDADVDHIVALKEAYQSQNINDPLSASEFNSLANDLDNLQLVGAAINRSKSDSDVAEFLPTYEPAQCIYVVRSIEIKSKYRLTVDSVEKQAMQNVLDNKCSFE